MLKTVSGSGRYMMVNGGVPATTYVNNSSGLMNVGNVRFNSSTQSMEVYDGYNWLAMNMSHAAIGLTPDAEMGIDWAIRRMHEEAAIAKLAESNQAIADLLEQKKDIDHKIKMVQTLVK